MALTETSQEHTSQASMDPPRACISQQHIPRRRLDRTNSSEDVFHGFLTCRSLNRAECSALRLFITGVSTSLLRASSLHRVALRGPVSLWLAFLGRLRCSLGRIRAPRTFGDGVDSFAFDWFLACCRYRPCVIVWVFTDLVLRIYSFSVSGMGALFFLHSFHSFSTSTHTSLYP